MKHWIMLISWITVSFSALPAAAQPPEQKSFDPEKMAEVLSPNESDAILGDNANAPLLVEYSSLSCTHCATFHNSVLPRVKTELIEQGKLRFVNRDFPLNASALRAAQLVRCAPKDRRVKFQSVLFKLQSRWAFTPDYKDKLQKIAAVGGIPEDEFNACMENETIEQAVIATRKEAGEHLPIEGTPSFFLAGKPFSAPLDADDFSQVLRTALATLAPANTSQDATEENQAAQEDTAQTTPAGEE